MTAVYASFPDGLRDSVIELSGTTPIVEGWPDEGRGDCQWNALDKSAAEELVSKLKEIPEVEAHIVEREPLEEVRTFFEGMDKGYPCAMTIVRLADGSFRVITQMDDDYMVLSEGPTLDEALLADESENSDIDDEAYRLPERAWK
jgi:hypothetical protein